MNYQNFQEPSRIVSVLSTNGSALDPKGPEFKPMGIGAKNRTTVWAS